MSSMTMQYRFEDEVLFERAAEDVEPWAVVYLTLGKHVNGQGILSFVVHGPFANEAKAKKWEDDMRRTLGQGYLRPMVSAKSTIAQLSAD